MLLILTWIVGLGTAAAILLAALLVARQERIVFQPPPPPHPAEAEPARRVDYRAADGQPLLAWLVGEPSSRRLLIMFHGNAELAVWSTAWADEVARRTGYLVMLAEYRGYAGLPGTPTYAGGALDARAAYRFGRETLGIAPGDIVLYGFSLGSAIATELASEVQPRALVLEAPLTSARDMARVIVAAPLATLWERLSRVHYDTERRVRELRCPVWVAHGDRDMVIPVRMGKRVHEAAHVKGELLLVQGASHNELREVAAERYWTWLEGALR